MNYFRESIKSGLNEYDLILKKSLDSLSDEELIWKPNPHSNNIIFLLWHMILVEDNLINTVLFSVLNFLIFSTLIILFCIIHFYSCITHSI